MKYHQPILHAHTCHEFFFCLEGTGWQYAEDREYPMKKGDLFFFPAGQPHIGSSNKDNNCLGGVINLASSLFPRNVDGDDEARDALEQLILQANQGNNRINLTHTGTQKITEIFQRIHEENAVMTEGYRCVWKICFQELLLVIIRESSRGNSLKQYSRKTINQNHIQRVFMFLENNYHQPVEVTQMASLAQMSRSRFHIQFRKHTGKTMLQYLNEIRIRNAIELLKGTELTTKEIAKQCGFPSTSNFYRTLRTTFGKPPNEIRGESRETGWLQPREY